MPSRHKILFIFLSLFAMGGLLFAQRDLGTITGTITDPQGAAVPNAKITITEDATGVSTSLQSNETGAFTRPAMKAGTYTVTVEAPGFQKAQQKNVLINAGAPTSENVTLQVGNASQTVEVTAAAPLLQTESPAIGANLNSAQMSQLPLGGQRTFTYLARLSPGILPAESGARDALNGGFSANGVRSTGENNFLLNGVDNNVNVIDFINQTSFVIGPSVEAIGDMTVITNGNNAEYGRAAGGVVNVNLKSGTNELHGVLFEILQNDKLNANRWENNKSGTKVPTLKQNQFGAAVGGPIIKNKLFMFGDYQATRIATAGGVIQNLGYGGLNTIPTQAMIGGDFSSLLAGGGKGQIYDPTTTTCTSGCTAGTLHAAPGQTAVYTRSPFANNRIPVSMMDPASMKIASLYPATNQGILTGKIPQNDYFISTPGALNTDQGDGRADYRINDRNSIFGSLSWSNTSKSSGAPFAGILDGGDFNGTSEIDLGRNAQLSYTRLWSSAIVSETRVGFSRLVTSRTQANSDIDAFKVAGIGGYNPTQPLNGGIPQIHFNDSGGTGRYRQVGANDWLPTKEYNNVWDFIQNVAITKGSHSFKFGAEFRPIQFPFFQVPSPHGEMNFSSNDTAFPSTNGTLNNTNTGDPVASFLLGSLSGGQISTTNFVSSTKKAYAFYAQDDWKVTSKLTLNIGLRYELFSPIGERFGRQSSFVLQDLTLYIPKGPNQNDPLPVNFSQLFPTVKVDRGSVDQYLVPWDKADIGPRVGFAYNIRQKTVVRGAYGIFYGGEENQGGSPNRGESAPFNTTPQLNRPAGVGTFEPNPSFANGGWTHAVSIGYPLNVFNGFPVTSLQFRSLATDFRNPMVQKWNFAIQHELPGQMALEVSYVGNHSSHQLLQPDFNFAPNFATNNTSINGDFLRNQKLNGAYQGIGSIAGTATWGWGNYHGMTAKLEKRLTNGLQFVTSYTYGHALANSGTTLSGSNGNYTKDPSNWNTSYANAAWDIRHNFTTAFNYDIPFGRGKRYGANMNRVVNALVGGWATNGILTLHTGQPFTLRANGCNGVWSGCSPFLVAGTDPNAAPSIGRNPDQWFNTSNLLLPQQAIPSGLTQGNLGLQTNYGPPTRTLDFSLFKNFAFTERIGLQFRAEGTNIANTPQFGVPDNNRQDSNFGQVTSTAAGSERHIQFALRLHF
jgi:carboxypeptidase family protein